MDSGRKQIGGCFGDGGRGGRITKGSDESFPGDKHNSLIVVMVSWAFLYIL